MTTESFISSTEMTSIELGDELAKLSVKSAQIKQRNVLRLVSFYFYVTKVI